MDSSKIANGSLSATPLTQAEILHYSRQLILPELGLEGQHKLKGSRVLVVGAGGLGSPVLIYLAAAGIGTLGIVEDDRVDHSNLHRQILFGVSSVGSPKIEAARARLRDINPHVTVNPHATRLTAENALDIIENYNLVVDATDNFSSRYLINDACVLLGKPNVSASIFRFEGQVSVFWTGKGPCYRCLYPEAPPADLVPSCAEGGVLGFLPGIIGILQANEVVKVLLDIGEPLIGRLLVFDALAMRFREFDIAHDSTCPICSPQAGTSGQNPYDVLRSRAAAADACAIDADLTPEIAALELAQQLMRAAPPFLLDVRGAAEFGLASIPGAVLIPLAELDTRLNELPADRTAPIVCYCHTGKRSRRAVTQLRDAGFTDVLGLRGGIDAWSRQVDQATARY